MKFFEATYKLAGSKKNPARKVMVMRPTKELAEQAVESFLDSLKLGRDYGYSLREVSLTGPFKVFSND